MFWEYLVQQNILDQETEGMLTSYVNKPVKCTFMFSVHSVIFTLP